MRRTLLVVAAAAAVLLIVPVAASAHSVAGTYDFAVPRWLWLVASILVVILTFVVVVLAPEHPEREEPEPPPAGARHPGLQRAGRIVLPVLEVLSVALMALAIVSCLAGPSDPNESFGTIYFWVVWWVLLGILACLLCDIYAWFSPWGIVARRVLAPLAGDPEAVGRIPYPAKLGRWPGALLLLAFSWLELVYDPAREPQTLGLLLVAWTVIALVLPLVFGSDAFERCVDPFGVLSATLSRASVLEPRAVVEEPCEACVVADATPGVRIDCTCCYRRTAPEHRELRLRWPGLGVLRGGSLGRGGAAVVVVLLGTVVFDGFSQTLRWSELVTDIANRYPSLNPSTSRAIETIGLLVAVGFLALLLVLCARFLPGGPARFAAALVPIAGVYFVAHYFAYVLVLGQETIELVSDPLGRGWNLFGTADYHAHDFLTASAVWYIQVALIVYGHAVAIVAAHRLGRARGEGRSLAAELPAAALAVAYTFVGLWVLAEQIKPD